MKKLLFLLLITFLFSCEKTEPCKICQTVTIVTTQYCPYADVREEVIFEACGDRLKEVDGENIIVSTSIFDCPAVMVRKTTCN